MYVYSSLEGYYILHYTVQSQIVVKASVSHNYYKITYLTLVPK